jgi:hypothetical protein
MVEGSYQYTDCSKFVAEYCSKDRKYRKESKEQNDSFDLNLIG